MFKHESQHCIREKFDHCWNFHTFCPYILFHFACTKFLLWSYRRLAESSMLDHPQQQIGCIVGHGVHRMHAVQIVLRNKKNMDSWSISADSFPNIFSFHIDSPCFWVIGSACLISHPIPFSESSYEQQNLSKFTEVKILLL